MRLVKTRPRFKCDFCNFKATEPTVEKHERICWKNPDRYCNFCKNTGYTDEGDGVWQELVPCYYCSQYGDEYGNLKVLPKKIIKDSKLVQWLHK